jgi:hypothetical protein
VLSFISTKTGVAPLNIKAFAVETNVNEDIITSSPGLILRRDALISKAEVHEVVSKASDSVYFSNHSLDNLL